MIADVLISDVMATGYGDDILEHHGRKGQKWGKENGPPYPLSRLKGGIKSIAQYSKKMAKAVKKAGKKTASVAKAVGKAGKKTVSVAKTLKKDRNERKEAKKAKALAKAKQKVMRSNSADYVYKHRHLLDNKELKDKLNRMKDEDEIRKRTRAGRAPGMLSSAGKTIFDKSLNAAGNALAKQITEGTDAGMEKIWAKAGLETKSMRQKNKKIKDAKQRQEIIDLLKQINAK